MEIRIKIKGKKEKNILLYDNKTMDTEWSLCYK